MTKKAKRYDYGDDDREKEEKEFWDREKGEKDEYGNKKEKIKW
jgi:hypothetical protein